MERYGWNHGCCEARFSSMIMNKKGFSPCHCLQLILQLFLVLAINVSVVRSETHRSSSSVVVVADVSYLPTSLSKHPRLSEISAQAFSGNEGSQIKGFQLKRAFIAVTPGILLPRCDINGLNSQLFNSELGFCDFRKYAKHHEAKIVQNYPEILALKKEVRMRKAKTGLKIFSPLSHGKSCKCESLSAVGISQLILLGEHFLKSYFGKLSSLENVSQHPKFAETIGEETLYQSLNAVLHGLLTEKQFVAVDVAKLSADFSRPTSTRGKLHQDLDHFVKQSYDKETHLFKNTKVSAFQSNFFLEKYFGSDLSSKDIISLLSNSIFLESHPLKNTKSESKLIESLNLSHVEIDQLFNASDHYHSYLSSSPIFQTYARSRTVALRQLLKIWLLLLPQANINIDNSDNLKLVSIDSLFMLSLLSSLNIPVTHHILPSSRLAIEIHELPTHNKGSYPSKSDPKVLKMAIKTNPRTSENSAKKPNQPIYVKLGMEKLILNTDSGFPVRNIAKKTRLKTQSENEESGLSQEFKERQTDFQGAKRGVQSHDYDQNVLKSASNENKPLRFVRILYNGQMVTSHIPGCEDDDMVSLGLCSVKKLENILDILISENSDLHFKREEL